MEWVGGRGKGKTVSRLAGKKGKRRNGEEKEDGRDRSWLLSIFENRKLVEGCGNLEQ